MTIERFGTLNGQDVLQVSLEGPDGMAMQVLTWGAVVRDLTVPLAGGSQRVVLRLNSIEDYVAHSPYFGAIVGRYGNRIGKARFILDGETYGSMPTRARTSFTAAARASARACGASSTTPTPA